MQGAWCLPVLQYAAYAETAAHLTDHVFPHLPVRQWVLSVPRRLRYFLQNNPKALNAALRIFLRVIERSLRQHCPSAAGIDKIHIGACAFIHRFGSSLNTHVHFHICAIDGVFEMVPATDGAQGKGALPGVHFHPASGLDGPAIAQVQSETRRRILRAFVQRGLIDSDDAKEMVAHQHGGGFSVDAGSASIVVIALRWSDYCATARGHHLPWSDYTSGARSN